MITAVDYEQMPKRPSRERTPGRLFADQSVQEFISSGEKLVEVTGWPDGLDAARQASFLRAAAHHMGAGLKVNVFQRMGHVYMERR